MSVLTAACPRRHSIVRVPVSSLLALHLVGGDAPGSLERRPAGRLTTLCDAIERYTDLATTERATQAEGAP